MILTADVEYDWGRSTTRNLQFLTGLFNYLDDTQSTATLFVLGDIAEKVEEFGVSKRVEIASHGMSHVNLQGVSEDDLLNELRNSKELLENTFKTRVRGFRAPFFMPPENLWEVLKAVGYEYSSSLVAGWFPGRYHNRIEPKPFERSGVTELPVPRFRLIPVPFGLSFMRLMWPVSVFLEPKKPYLFYYHTTELLKEPPGGEESPVVGFLYGLHRGMRARRILYNFLTSHGPTQSVQDYLSK